MKRLLVMFLWTLCALPAAQAQLFSDDFTRAGDPGSLRSWTAYQGPWTVTNGVMRGGPSTNIGYGYAYTTTNRFTNFSVSARIQLPVGAFGGGLGGRMDTNSGSHYAAWIYPEGSGGGSTMFKLIRFDSYAAFTVLTNLTLSSVGTNFHTVKLDFAGSQITAAFDTNQIISATDATYASGALSLDMYTDGVGYVMTVDDVLVPSQVPTANNDSYSMSGGTTLTVTAPGVLSNDTGGAGSLTAVQGVGPTHGTLSLNSNGGFTYTPTNGYTGLETFTYRASDGITNSALATVTITVNVNHVPVANDESFSMLTNTVLTVAAPGVLANDTDSDANPLTAVLAVGPLRGNLSFNSNGSFTYTPTNNYVGADSFTYRANDGLTNSGIATVSIIVAPASNLFYDSFTRSIDPTNLTSPWVVNSGNWSVTGGQLKGGTNLPSAGYGFAYLTNRLTNYVVSAQVKFPVGAFGGGIGGRWDTNNGAHYAVWLYPDGSSGGADLLKIIRFTGASNAAPFFVLGQASLGLQGTNFHNVKLALQGNRIGAYLDGSLLLNTTDATLADGLLASVDLWTDASPYVMGVDDVTAKSLAIDDAYNVNAATTTTVTAPGILANDTGVSSTNLTASLATGPTKGILSLDSNGGFTYTPTNGYTGTDTFTYQPNDGAGALGTATVTITVQAMNSAPTLGTQTNRTIVELTSLTVTNAGSDADVPPDALSYSLTVTNTAGVVSGPTISSNGVITWTPTEAQGPSTNTFRTIVTDDGTPPLTATNTFIVVVTETNTAPFFTTTPPDRTVNELASMTVTNRPTDTDLPANTLNYVLNVTNSLGAAVSNATISAAGVITWTPTEAQGPSTNTFTTRVTDTGSPALSVTNTFVVTVNEVNNAPTLPAQTNRTILPLSALTITNTASDTNLPAATLTYTLTVTNAAGAVGNASISSAGVITWTPTTLQDQTTNVFTTVVSNFNSIAVNSQRLAATNSFTVVVNGRPVVVTNSASLLSEGCITNNNAIDPGETVTVQFSFKNVGLANSANLVVTLLETNGVFAPSGPVTYGTLIAGGAAVSNSFTFTAGGSCGDTITATLQLQEGATNLGMATFSFPLGKLTQFFSENFDGVTAPALPVGWTTASSGFQSNWVTQTAVRDTLPNSIFSNDGGNVGVNELVSPAIVLPAGSSQLSFRNNYNLEALAGAYYDGGVLEIRIGAPTNFTDIITAGGSFITGGYVGVIDPGYQNPLINRQAWSGNSGGFITTTVTLPAAAAGQSIQLRWRCGTDSGNGGTGWRVDTISITGRVCCANSAPILPTPTNRTTAESSLVLVTNTVTSLGVPANPITYALLSAPSGATIDTNGIISWLTTEANGPSTNIFTTAATNSGVPSLYTTNTFTVVVTEVNSAPALPGTTNYTIVENSTLNVTNTASDSDIPANALSYSLTVANDAGAVTNADISPSGVITWTPTEAQGPSTNIFTTVVTDNSSPALSATNTFTVVVTEANSAPTLPGTTNYTIVELSTLTVTNSASDSDLPANALGYSLSVSNAAGAITNANISASGVITWTPTEAQGPSTNTFTTIVTDNGSPALSATNTFSVVVTEANSAPTLPGTTNYTIAELTALTVTNTASDSDLPANSLTYTLTVTNDAGPVTNASISAGGIITWTPLETQGPSTNTFTTIVTDDGSPALSATNTFTVVVTEANSAPTLPGTTNYTIAELTVLTVTNTAGDSDVPANTIVYSLTVVNEGGAVTNASISAGGVITWTPSEAQGPSTNTFTTVVTDDSSPGLSATNTFTVVVTEANSAPVLPGADNHTIAELTTLTVTNTASDSDLPANTIVYSLTVVNEAGAVTNASISAGGVITWTPSEAQGPSTNTFTTVVTDDGSPALSATNTFTVVVTEANSAPTLPGANNHTITELTTLTVTNTASDSDLPANTTVYSLTVVNEAGAVTNASISAGGVITWTPTAAQGPSTNTFTTIATDDGSPALSATNTFTVVVTEANSAPILPGTTNYTIAEFSTLTVTNTASDSDLPANALTYSLTVVNEAGAVTNASISAGGVITWTPSEAQGLSTNTFTTIATDDGSPALTATNTFIVIVTELNNAPAFLQTPADQTINELTTLTVTNSATDSDIPANTLTYALTVNNAAGSVTNAAISSAGVITWTPGSAQAPSTNTFVTVATDDGSPNLSVTNTFIVVVNALAVASTPVISSITVSSGIATITWSSVSERTYRLQYTDSLSPTNWQDQAPDITATGSTASSTNAVGSATERYYRVILLP